MSVTAFKNIPVTEWNKMLRAIEKLSKVADHADIINERQAAELLDMKTTSLQARRYDGTIPESCYSKTVTGSYVYFKSKLLNL